MTIYERKSQFGWTDDGGIGEQLINQILAGKKTATAGPKNLYSQAELDELYASIGKPATVIDKDGNSRCNIFVSEVFETRFGAPDPRLVFGEGHGNDAEEFKSVHRLAWADLVESGGLVLNDETVLIVELFHRLPD